MKNLRPPHIITAPSIIRHDRVHFSSCHSLERFYKVLIISTLGCFIIEVSRVVLVLIILTKNRIKYLTPASVGVARSIGMLPAIAPMDWNKSKLGNISFSMKLQYKGKFSDKCRFFDRSTYFKFPTRVQTLSLLQFSFLIFANFLRL